MAIFDHPIKHYALSDLVPKYEPYERVYVDWIGGATLNFLLLVNGQDHLLLVDGNSKLILAQVH